MLAFADYAELAALGDMTRSTGQPLSDAAGWSEVLSNATDSICAAQDAYISKLEAELALAKQAASNDGCDIIPSGLQPCGVYAGAAFAIAASDQDFVSFVHAIARFSASGLLAGPPHLRALPQQAAAAPPVKVSEHHAMIATCPFPLMIVFMF